MKSYQVHLIRHGLTDANFNGQYIGATDVDLSAEGVARLHKLKSEATYPTVDKIFCSPLLRCRHTAEILYPAHTDFTIENDFAECNFGDWEGKTADELKNNKDFLLWLKNSEKARPNGGESLKSFNLRVTSAFERLVETVVKGDIKDTAIVTHGGVIMTILAAFGVPRAKFFDWVVNNGCGYSVRIMPSLWMRQKVVEVYAKVPYNLARENDEESAYIVDLVRGTSESDEIHENSGET